MRLDAAAARALNLLPNANEGCYDDDYLLVVKLLYVAVSVTKDANNNYIYLLLNRERSTKVDSKI